VATSAIRHRGVERIHLVDPHQTDIGYAVRNRYRDSSPWMFPCCFFVCRFNRKASARFKRSTLADNPFGRKPQFLTNTYSLPRILVWVSPSRHRLANRNGAPSWSLAPRFILLAAATASATNLDRLMDSSGGRVTEPGVDIRNPLRGGLMIETIFSSSARSPISTNTRRQLQLAPEDLRRAGFDAVANIVMHGTFYVTARQWARR